MRKGLFVLILLVFCTHLQAGNDFRAKGGESDALGGHSTTLINAFTVYNNQGALAFLEQTSFGLSYESSYFPASINTVALTAASPLGFGVLGGSVEYFGNSLYYELKAGLAYGMRLGNKVGLGVQLDYLNSKAQDYDGKNFVTFEIGLLYEPIEQLRVGFHIYNPIKYKVSDNTDEILPIVFKAGLNYIPHEQIDIYAELTKDIEQPFSFSGGLSYQVIDQLAIRGGFSTNPTILSFGVGLQLVDFLQLDIGSNYHTELGFNTNASLAFQLTKKKGDEEQ